MYLSLNLFIFSLIRHFLSFYFFFGIISFGVNMTDNDAINKINK